MKAFSIVAATLTVVIPVALGQSVTDASSLISSFPGTISSDTQIAKAASSVTDALSNGAITGEDLPTVMQALFNAVQPVGPPSSVADATTLSVDLQNNSTAISIKRDTTASAQDLLTQALNLLLNGFTSTDLNAVISGVSPVMNSYNNVNPPLVPNNIYYNVSTNRNGRYNAPFSVSEAQLRAAIYIPTGFQYGKDGKQTVILAPGTGSYGGGQFSANVGKLLQQEDKFAPVYLNIPINLLGDVQLNAEYVAYAIQYMSALCSQKVAIVSWSQGGIDAQWAFKYFQSTRDALTDHIALAPDYKGTQGFNSYCPGGVSNQLACTPAVSQQNYFSNFINRLRLNGGDGALVTTTTVSTTTDQTVLPQGGTTGSGYLAPSDVAAVTNTYIQEACAGQPAGGNVTHEGILYNALAYALVIDALTHDGPGQAARVVANACSNNVSPGLSLTDVLNTEALIPLITFNILTYQPKVTVEPPLMAYATF